MLGGTHPHLLRGLSLASRQQQPQTKRVLPSRDIRPPTVAGEGAGAAGAAQLSAFRDPTHSSPSLSASFHPRVPSPHAVHRAPRWERRRPPRPRAAHRDRAAWRWPCNTKSSRDRNASHRQGLGGTQGTVKNPPLPPAPALSRHPTNTAAHVGPCGPLARPAPSPGPVTLTRSPSLSSSGPGCSGGLGPQCPGACGFTCLLAGRPCPLVWPGSHHCLLDHKPVKGPRGSTCTRPQAPTPRPGPKRQGTQPAASGAEPRPTV